MTLEFQEKGLFLDIILEGNTIHTCDKRLFSKKLQEMQCETEEEFQARFSELEYKVSFAFSLRRIAKKSYHTQELMRLLQKKRITSSTIQRIITNFSEKKWLQDESWLELFVEKLVRLGKSPLEIMQKAKQRGIDRGSLLPFLKNKNCAEEALSRLISKRYPQLLDKQTSFPIKQKAIAALIRKGFSLENIRESIKYI